MVPRATKFSTRKRYYFFKKSPIRTAVAFANRQPGSLSRTKLLLLAGARSYRIRLLLPHPKFKGRAAQRAAAEPPSKMRLLNFSIFKMCF
eukprot:SAG31_NODE_1485_length_8151_cov_6.486215_2_plen_90_part_00